MQQPYRPGMHNMHAELASLTIWPDPPSVLQLCISVDFVSYIVAWGFSYAQSHSDNGHVYATAQWREDRLQQQWQAMKDNYDKICSENQKIMHCLPGRRKTRKREEQEMKPWRKLETKPEY